MFHIFGKTLGIAVVVAVPGTRMHRLPVLELRRNLDHRLADHHRDGIQIAAVGGQAQTLRFQRDRASARERIVNRR